MLYTVEQLKNLITPIAKKHGVKTVSLFGSYSRGEATENSDVDLIIDAGEIRSMWGLSSFRLDVEDVLALPVDLVTTGNPDREFLGMIKQDEVLLYESM